jgi:hypothetical protein
MAIGGGAAAAPLAFGGATIGMSLSAWRALAPPDGVDPTARPACSSDTRVVAAGSSALSPALLPGGEVACAYASVYGRTVLISAAPLAGRYVADDLRFVFAEGRLDEIDFRTSVDAYNVVEAQLSARYGPPTATTRVWAQTAIGRLARVQQTWSASGGTVTLTDPAKPLSDLQVRLIGTRGGARHATTGRPAAVG